MGYFSDLDIAMREMGLIPHTVRTTPRPLVFEYKTPTMVKPETIHTKVTNGMVCLWPGCWVTEEWFLNLMIARDADVWFDAPGFDARVRYVGYDHGTPPSTTIWVPGERTAS